MCSFPLTMYVQVFLLQKNYRESEKWQKQVEGKKKYEKESRVTVLTFWVIADFFSLHDSFFSARTRYAVDTKMLPAVSIVSKRSPGKIIGPVRDGELEYEQTDTSRFDPNKRLLHKLAQP